MINTNKSLENVLRKVVVAAYEAAMDLDEEHEVRVYIFQKPPYPITPQK